MAQIPGAWVTMISDPCSYSPAQLNLACRVAHWLHRGRLVLCVPPECL